MVLLECALLLPTVVTNGTILLTAYQVVTLLKTVWTTLTVDALNHHIDHDLHIDLVMIMLVDALRLLTGHTLIAIVDVLQLLPSSRQGLLHHLQLAF